MSDAVIWSGYRRRGTTEMRPYVVGEDLSAVAIAPVDRQAGSPREGDYIARNPANHGDQWLVSARYFAEQQFVPDGGEHLVPMAKVEALEREVARLTPSGCVGVLIVDVTLGERAFHAEIESGLNPERFDTLVRAVQSLT